MATINSSNGILQLPADRLMALAARLKGRQERGRIQPRAHDGRPIPLSYSQERLWFLDQLEPGTAFYNIPGASRFQGKLALPALSAALDEMVKRHESLRTTFGDDAGRPFQVVSPPAAVFLPLVDLAGLPEAPREAELQRLALLETRRPFDLARGPLLRVALLRAGEEDHAVVYTMHHILSDGWSSLVFLREMAALYGAFSAGRPSPLPPLPIQYPDYAVWQRSYLAGEVLAKHLAYWRERLRGSSGLELPGDRPRPPVETFRGMARPVALSEATTRALKDLGRREGVSLFMTLLAVFDTLLLRYTGQTDIPIGSPIANRNRREVEGVIGFFSNTIVLRTDLSGDPTFRELLARVREVTLGAYSHEDLPFERIVEEVQPDRDMSRNPLFQVMCVLQNQPRSAMPAGDLEMAPLQVSLGAAKFDLTIFWSEAGDALHGLVEHNTDLFDETTIRRFYAQHETLLGAVGLDPTRRLSELPLVALPERHQMLYEWNETAAPAAPCAVHEWVEAQVARTPRALAVVFEGESLTYEELDRRANRMAHGLRRRGVAPERLVGICVERSLEMAVAALAVLKAGGALVALDPAYPRDRLATIIDDAGLAVLLTERSLLRHFPDHEAIALLIEQGTDPFPDESPEGPRAGVLPDHPMYAIYTSGSTGQPKGIVVPHRAFANLLAWQLEQSPLAGRSRTVQFSTFGFCVSFQEIFSSWCSGGTLVMASEITRKDVLGLGRFLEENAVERLHLPFAALKHLADTAGLPAAQLTGSRLKEIITAGEQLQVTPAVRGLFERLPGCSLHNQYGASETHVVSAQSLFGDPGGWPAIPPVGRPIANVRIHLLDRRLEPVPIGVRGELYAAGECVARGYLNDPVLTAEKMIPNPYGTAAGARLYRTGDLARHLADGRIEYLGRIDGQVKVRGFRVELGEVETTLARHPDVRDAAVVATGAAAAGTVGTRLIAYVVPETAGALRLDDLRVYLKRSLPDYMVPAAFVTLADLPLNANGKLDQAALPKPQPGSDGGGRAAFVAPRTPVEEILAGLWSELLGIDRVGALDNFFELGGHSLLVTQLVSRARSALGVELPIRRLFEAPTLEALAREVEIAAARAEGAAPPPARRRGSAPPPLSFGQERLWFLDRLEPGRAVYNMPLALSLRGRLDLAALAASLGSIVARHEALRTVFADTELGPVQVISAPSAAAPPRVDLTGLPVARREAAGVGLAEDEAARPFDLARGPLLRTTLLRLQPDWHMALFTMHHIVSDGWSLGVLVREMGALYAGYSRGERPALPPLPVQYADYALWQRQWLSGAALERQIDFWRDSLADAPALVELPLDRPRPPVQTLRGAVVGSLLPAALPPLLGTFSRARGATLFMVLLAGFQALLGRLSGQEDVVVGSPVANRTRIETEGLIGFFVNTLALRGRLAGDPTFGELVAQVRRTTLAAYAHQDLPFERLVEELEPERSLAYTPIFQVMLGLQNAPMGALELPGLTLEPVATQGARSAKFDLNVSLAEGGGSIGGTWEYNVDLFEAVTVERLARQLAMLLAAAVEAPETPLAELPLLSAAERRQIERWNTLAGEAATGASLHERFEVWAAAEPGRVALVWGEERIAYGELEARANRLARRLRQLGVGPEALVGVCLERSPAMVVALLAVLKAGGAYLPLDPAYPAGRLAAMLADSGAAIVLTGPGSPALPDDGRRRFLALDRLEVEAEADEPRIALARERFDDPRRLAYVLYTSGSTGRPKGVAVEHRSVVAMLGWATDEWGDALDGVLAGTSIAFDISVFELFAPLSAGGRVILAPNALALPRLPAAGEVTLLNTVPSAMAELLREGAPPLPGSIRVVNLAGEALARRLVDAVHALPHVERVYNLYGPTEDTTYSTFSAVPAGGVREPAIGRPIAGTRIHLVDRGLRPVPLGGVGEVYLAGAGLSRGYLGRPDMTAERYIPDPFSAGGARLYRTGDLARWRADGELEFVARVDQQVKVRGFRIEPGEIEAVLSSHPAVAAAAVVVREGRAGRELLACVAAKAGEAPVPAALKAYLAERLPDYLVPPAYAVLPALPSTQSGKVDRRALARLDMAAIAGAVGADGKAAPIAPRDAVEMALAAIWEELLGVEGIGVRDTFFDLGGHSLLAVRLMTRIERQLGRELPLSTLFRAPTIEGLAAILRAGEPQTQAASALVPLVQPAAGDAAPGAAAAPLFLVHPIGGSVFCYRELARRLGGRAVYGLQARGFAGEEQPIAGVPEMAAAYLESLVLAQPAGPYHLGGWSFGALVALEMARQLLARGESVALLALVDPMTITPEERARELDDVGMLSLLVRDLGGLAGAPVPVTREELDGLAGPADRLDFLLTRATEAGILPPDADLPRLRRIVALYQANQRAARAYLPLPTRCPIHLLAAAAGPLPSRLDLWNPVAEGGLEVRILPGDHYTLLRPPAVDALATELARLLAAGGEPVLTVGDALGR
jgi:amino acid adenylation domain-containing protein